MSRERSLAKNTLILSIGAFFPKLVSIITLPILTGVLTKNEYGSYDLIVTLASLFLPIITLQIQSAAFRFLIDARKDQKTVNAIISNIMAFTIPVSVAGLIVLYLFIPGIPAFTKLLVCAYYFFDILYVSLQQVTRGLSYHIYYSISAIVLSLLNLLSILLFVSKFLMGLNGILISLIVSYAAATLFLSFKIRNKWTFTFSLVSLTELKHMLSYSWPMVFNNLSSWILRLSDRLIITLFLGVRANAIYAVACKIPNLLLIAQSTFTMAWHENAVIASKDEDAANYYSKMYDYIFSIIAGITALLIAATPVLFHFLVRGSYDEAYKQMPLLFIGTMFCCLSAFQGGIYVAYSKTKDVGLTTAAAAVINLLINLLLVKEIGITAASVATLISYFALTAFRMHDLQKIIHVEYQYVKNISVSFILTGICILSAVNSLYMNILNAVIALILCGILVVTQKK
ncbi:MAG: oligosaccharide flippase family protein [Oscillospiraceae bacterium]